MKKLFAMLLALIMVLSMAACGAQTPAEAPKTDAPATEASKTDAPAAESADPEVNKKVALILQAGGLGDQGFNDTAYAGLVECKDQYGLDINYVECADATQGETLIRELCEAGYGLVINLEASISANMYHVALDYPEIEFVAVGRQLRINAVDGITETPANVYESYITLEEPIFRFLRSVLVENFWKASLRSKFMRSWMRRWLPASTCWTASCPSLIFVPIWALL